MFKIGDKVQCRITDKEGIVVYGPSKNGYNDVVWGVEIKGVLSIWVECNVRLVPPVVFTERHLDAMEKVLEESWPTSSSIMISVLRRGLDIEGV